MCAKSGQPDEGRDTFWASWRAVRQEAGPYSLIRGERRTNSSDRPAHATDNVGKGLGEDSMLRWVVAAGLVLLTTAALADSKSDCLDSKDHDLRIKGCSSIILRNPKDVIAYHNRGDAYGLKGDVDRAIADYNKAIELNPNYAPAYISRGRAYTSKGDYIHAVADVTKAGELTPKLRPWPAVVKAAPAKPKEVGAKPVSTDPDKGLAAEKVPVPTKAPVAEKPADDSWPAWAQSRLAN
jgi:tetratricopeptide (TPR) repeat protein